MPVRHLGLFVAFGPTVDLQKEGLGRLLLTFLQAASTREDIRFVIACPQWARKGLLSLCESENISPDAFDIVTTRGVPLALRMYLSHLESRRRKRRKSRIVRLSQWLKRLTVRSRRSVERRLITTRNIFSWLALGATIVALAILAIPAGLLWMLLRLSLRVRSFFKHRFSRAFGAGLRKTSGIFMETDEPRLYFRLYHMLLEDETARLVRIVNSLTHVKAWYSPAAFWPAFNGIVAPRLMCIPDVVPNQFPVGFAVLEPEFLQHVETVEKSIRGGENFVTYSAEVKWKTLVERYGVAPEKISVIPHACMDLSSWVTSDPASVLTKALQRTGVSEYVKGLPADSFRFLFYASQFRPNKNLVSLLRAYEYLLRERFVHHKLILTGDSHRYDPVRDFIRERSLEKDVICLHGLTTAELAACYHLADLAVNPSLSEGGCPFTFTEALSVGTPVVMARIPVTEEVIVDQAIRDQVLFDPFDWRDIGSKMEWALSNRQAVLDIEMPCYEQLRRRTPDDMVREMIEIMEHLEARV